MNLRRVVFYFEEADRFYAGMATGATWNGWPVLLAEPETVEAIWRDFGEHLSESDKPTMTLRVGGRDLMRLDGFTPTILEPADLAEAMKGSAA